ncbi:TetR/AcrR family transcriptional regulator [Nocardia sputorum]|uniref:HTH tetR-type domain-containing protein n=1 Tax=Nocardia sputorum TaxID=2984338 RepID=A0ABN6U2B6_9NOCA|nr:TetR/AcrR family transcriptional regulator [Nocardia sputorum]BDT99309.1 hypothetical protein IFM12276_23380 [Nocardia sputorum]
MASPSGRGRGRPRIDGLAEQRRSQIIEAAYEVFADQGFEATTVGAIAKRAGIGHGTVYRYFDSKIEILREVFDYTAERLFQVLDLGSLSKPIESMDALADRIATTTARLSDLVNREPRLLKIVTVEISSADPEMQARVMSFERMLAGRLASTLSRAIAAGQVRPEVNPDAYGHLLLSLTMPTFLDAFQGRLAPALRYRHTAAIVGLLENALRTRPVQA